MKLILPFAFGAALLGTSFGETYYLKNGKVVVGEKIDRGGGKFEVKTRSKKGINTFTAVTDADIVKVTREDIEKLMLEEMQALIPVADLMKVEWYAETHNENFQKFHTEFPDSDLIPEVEKVQAIFEAEQKIIVDGGIKLNGEMILAVDRKALAYDLDSKIAAVAFKEAVEKKRFATAIDIAEDMELDFSKSRAYGEVVHSLPEMCKKFSFHLDRIDKERMREAAGYEKAKMEAEPDRFKVFDSERTRKMERIKKAVMAQQEKGMKWKDINMFSEESIDETRGLLKNYEESMTSKAAAYIDLDAGGKFTAAWRHVEKGEFELAKPIIDKLQAIGLNSAYFLNLSDFYSLEKKIADDKERNAKRKGPEDEFEPYLDTDFGMIEALHEVSDIMNSIEDLKTAQAARGEIKARSAKLRRSLERRADLKPLVPQDMESLNAEFALELRPLIAKFENSLVALNEKTEFVDTVREAVDEFAAVIPNPDDYLTENAQAMIAAAEREAATVDIHAGLASYTVSIKNDSFVKTPIAGEPRYFIAYYASSTSEDCKKSAPDLVNFYNEKIAKNPNVELVMISSDEKQNELLVWGLNEKFPWPIVVKEDAPKASLAKYAGEFVPHYVMVDSKGFVVSSDKNEIIDNVNSLPKELIKKDPDSRPATKKDIKAVKDAFKDFTAKMNEYNYEAAGYYLDSAQISATVEDANGKQELLQTPGSQYKEIMKKALLILKEKGDTSEMKDVTYELVGEFIVVEATRWSVLNKNDSPYEVSFAMTEDGPKIVEEKIVIKR